MYGATNGIGMINRAFPPIKKAFVDTLKFLLISFLGFLALVTINPVYGLSSKSYNNINPVL